MTAIGPMALTQRKDDKYYFSFEDRTIQAAVELKVPISYDSADDAIRTISAAVESLFGYELSDQ